MKKLFAVAALALCAAVATSACADTLTVSTDKTSYNQSQAMKVTAIFKRDSGAPITSPETREVRIRDSAGSELVKTSMSNAGNGVFIYTYTLRSTARTGKYEVRARFARSDDSIRAYTYPTVVTGTTPPPSDTTAPVTSATPAGGAFSAPVSVSLSANEAATIYYTTNGSTPTTLSAVYSAPLTIATTTTLKYFARDTAGNSEAVKTVTYTINTPQGDTTPPVTSASPAAGAYAFPLNVTLSANETATIYYTTNGSAPTTASTRYTGALALTAATTLKYFAVDAAGNAEAVQTAAYTAVVSGKIHPSLTYTSGSMCVSCHSTQAAATAGSVHYKWEGPYSKISNKPGVTGGKLNSAVNAYCINTLGNWNGCGSCHVGAGAKPGTVADTTNIDCLICHQPGYKRVRNATTALFEPDATKMTITMDQAVQTVVKPAKSTCLQCHAKGGGGDGLKRGDLALINGTTTDRNYDVHMATTGANLVCQSCHTVTSHKMAGRGSDLRPVDNAVAVSCATATCHSNKVNLNAGHATAAINTHMQRVACQTCHIPVYGKKAADAVVDATTGFGDQATETSRTWLTPEWSVANNRYEPTIVKANNLKPVYAFFDGSSWVSDLNDLAVLDSATGAYKISRPNGGINTANTKIYPFKYKTSMQPRHTASGKLIALNTSVYFKTADVAGAIQSGLINMGLNAADAYTMVKTDEYQMLNHTVSPKASALACTACHGPNTSTPGTQINLKSMGYSLKAAASTVCSQCHGSQSFSSSSSVHSRHVTSYKYDCSFCHTFSRAAERGLKTTK